MRPKAGIEKIKPYRGGKPIDEVRRELAIDDIVKLASNENPIGASPLAIEAVGKIATDLSKYPDGNVHYLREAVAEHLAIDGKNLIFGNGSNEILTLVGDTFISPGDEVIYSESAFVVYKLVAQICGAKSIVTPMIDRYHQDLRAMLEAITARTKVIFIANPNNPTGTMLTAQEVDRFMAQVPDEVLVLFDEAYAEYILRSDYPATFSHLPDRPNLIVTRTFSKIYGLAGLRIGYGVANSEIIRFMNSVRQPFNCNAVAQTAALASLKDQEHVERSRVLNSDGKKFLYSEFDRLGVNYVNSEGNFILLDVGRACETVANLLLREGIIIRPMGGYGFPNSIRVTIGTAEQNGRFISALEKVIVA